MASNIVVNLERVGKRTQSSALQCVGAGNSGSASPGLKDIVSS